MPYKSLSSAGRPMPVERRPQRQYLLLAAAGLLLVLLALAVIGLFGYAIYSSSAKNQATTTTQTTTTIITLTTTSQKPQATTTTTSKPQSTTTTTVKIKTATTTSVTTTATTTSTTTTQPRVACAKSGDCGQEKSYLRCRNEDIVTITETPLCKFTEEGSYCTILQKSQTYEHCSTGETCTGEKCVKVTTTTVKYVATTSTTIRFIIPTSTTTFTIPPATFCFGRSTSGSARSQSDCNGLKCGGTIGGITRTCTFIGDAESGHCTCK